MSGNTTSGGTGIAAKILYFLIAPLSMRMGPNYKKCYITLKCL